MFKRGTKMKLKIRALILFSLLAPVCLQAQVFDKFAATVNLIRPDAISVKQLEQRIDQIRQIRIRSGLPDVAVTRQDKLNVLEMMVSEKLLEQGIEDSGIYVTQQEIDSVVDNQKLMVEQQNGVKITLDQFKNAVVSQTKVAWDDYIEEIRSQLEQQKYISQERGDYIRENLTEPSREEIEEFYAANRSEFTNPEILRYSHVFISTINMNSSQKDDARKKAEDIYLTYQNGDMSFEDLVREYSDDDRSKISGGDAGFLARNDTTAKAYLGEAFIKELFKIPVGEVKGVFQSNIGYHIVRVTDHREARILNINDPIAPNTPTTVKDFISSQIMQQKQQQILSMAVEDLVADLRKDADIKIFTENIE